MLSYAPTLQSDGILYPKQPPGIAGALRVFENLGNLQPSFRSGKGTNRRYKNAAARGNFHPIPFLFACATVLDGLTSAILTSPHPHPLEQQNAHRVSLSLL
jgi:hypothetical protein